MLSANLQNSVALTLIYYRCEPTVAKPGTLQMLKSVPNKKVLFLNIELNIFSKVTDPLNDTI
jgi:hypothetical protein